jgi:TM2 domain-containing membrane protein YozV
MKKILLPIIIILINHFSFAQGTDFYSVGNRRMFGDYLFCQKDYLRAAEEYNAILNSNDNDTLRFKVGLSYIKIGSYDSASVNLLKVPNNSYFFNNSRLEYYKAQFLLNNYDLIESGANVSIPILKLKEFTYLYRNQTLPADREKFLIPFDGEERNVVSDFYDRKLNPSYKNELTAALLSTFIPGAGKIYTKEYGDGIIAFLVTGILSYISYTDFKAEHNFRGWLFAGLSAFFYGGNIYGSIASAQIYNASVNFSLSSDMKVFLENKNYFVPDYEFCK